MTSQQAASLQPTADCSRSLTHNEEIDFCIQQAVLREDYHTAAVLAAIDPQRKAVILGSAAGVHPHASAASHERPAQEKLQAASNEVRTNPFFFDTLLGKCYI